MEVKVISPEILTTKLVSKTQKAITVIALKAKEDPECKFTSLAHLLTKDFLKECFGELKKGKSSGIDGVTVGEYAKKLDENITDLVARQNCSDGDKDDSRSDL